MSHKDAPPETPEQRRMREFYTARGVNVGWGRGRSGAYLAPFAANAWAAWQEAQQGTQYEEVGWQYKFPSIWGDGYVWRDSSVDYNGSRYVEARRIYAQKVCNAPEPPACPHPSVAIIPDKDGTPTCSCCGKHAPYPFCRTPEACIKAGRCTARICCAD